MRVASAPVPAHAMVAAASLVKAGTYKTVVVTAGGCTAKLGMNGKDHVKKGLPILEDMLGGFAVLITAERRRKPRDQPGYRRPPHRGHRLFARRRSSAAWWPTPLERARPEDHRTSTSTLPKCRTPTSPSPPAPATCPLANYKMIARSGRQAAAILQKAELATFTAGARPGRLGPHPGSHPLRRALHRLLPARDPGRQDQAAP